MTKLPAVFLPHGGGPLPLLHDPAHAKLTAWLSRYAQDLQPKPKALCVVSAHWEEPEAKVTAAEKPPLIYDYFGFPPESYKIEWPAQGSPALAARVAGLLRAAGFPCHLDKSRGWDHGVFVPLKLLYPEADVPIVQLSLLSSLDPAAHVKMGAALAPLREEGVLIVGSGMSFHNMSVFMGSMGGRGVPAGALSQSKAFDDWLKGIVTSSSLNAAQRAQQLEHWAAAPHGRFAHPREEHLLPLMVVLGAAGADPAHVVWSDTLLGAHVTGLQFG